MMTLGNKLSAFFKPSLNPCCPCEVVSLPSEEAMDLYVRHVPRSKNTTSYHYRLLELNLRERREGTMTFGQRAGTPVHDEKRIEHCTIELFEESLAQDAVGYF
jgi:hypothetical protein